MCAKQIKKKFDQAKVVLPLKFMSLGCIMVTLRSETLLFVSTPQCNTLDICECLTQKVIPFSFLSRFQVVELVINQLTKLQKPFKYITTCVIMQKTGTID